MIVAKRGDLRLQRDCGLGGCRPRRRRVRGAAADRRVGSGHVSPPREPGGEGEQDPRCSRRGRRWRSGGWGRRRQAMRMSRRVRPATVSTTAGGAGRPMATCRTSACRPAPGAADQRAAWTRRRSGSAPTARTQAATPRNRTQRHTPGTGAVNTRNAVKTATVLPLSARPLLNGGKG